MPSISVSVPHIRTTDVALQKVQMMLQQLQRDYEGRVSNVRQRWDGRKGSFAFTAMGFDVSGTIEVSDRSVEIRGSIPWMATPFKGRIESTIREQTLMLLASASI